MHQLAIRQSPRIELRQDIFTQLGSLEVHKLSPCIQHLFYRFDVLFCFKSRENVEVVGGLVEDTEERALAAASSLDYFRPAKTTLETISREVKELTRPLC